MRLDLFWMTRDLFDERVGDVGFGLFTAGHFIWLAASFLLIVGIARLYGRGEERRRGDLRKLIALVLILSEIIKVCIIALTGAPNRYYLPLELCILAEYVILFDAFWPRRKLPGWLLAYSLAPAAVLALLFPTAANYPVIHFFTIHQFLIHALIAAYFIMRFRAGEIDTGYGGLWAEIGVLVLIVAVIDRLDAATGTNYMFLMDTEGNPPLGAFWDMTGAGRIPVSRFSDSGCRRIGTPDVRFLPGLACGPIEMPGEDPRRREVI